MLEKSDNRLIIEGSFISNDKNTDFLKENCYICAYCYEYPKIIFINKEKIKYICKCNKSVKIKIINNDLYSKYENLKNLNLTCKKHNNEKFIFYCFKCKKNLCYKCYKMCHSLKHKTINLKDNERQIERKVNRIKEEIFNRSKGLNKISRDYIKSKSIKNSKNFKIILDDSDNAHISNNNETFLSNSSLELLSIIEEKEDSNNQQFFNFCFIAINNFLNNPTYIQMENIDIIYQFFFSLKLKYKYDSNNIKLFGNEFILNNKDNFILYINDKEIDVNNINISLKIDYFDVIFIIKEGKKITDFSYMFNGISSLLYIHDLGYLDVSNAINLNNMFNECCSLVFLSGMSKWNISNVINMSKMFYRCNSLYYLEDFSASSNNNSISISVSYLKWDTSKVSDMSYLFYGCSSLKELPDISNWDVSQVIDMSYMFYGCSSLKELPDISNWDTHNLKNMDHMFSSCSSLEVLPDISKWNLNKVSNISHIFEFCESLKELPDIFKWEINNLIDSENMINGCPLLNSYSNDISEVINKNIKETSHLMAFTEKNNNKQKINKNKEKKKIFFNKINFLIFFLIIFALFIFIFKYFFFDNCEVKIIKNQIWKEYEYKIGAYYIAYSPLSIEYSEVSGNIKLPNSLNTNNGKRNAYISFGVLGLKGRIDIGIMNSGIEWVPFYHDPQMKKMFFFKKDFAPEEATKIKIKIEITPLRNIIFSLNFIISKSYVLKTFNTEIDASHILVYEKNYTFKKRFYRFVMLRPNGKDNQNDGSFMMGGEFNELNIVKNNINQFWGIYEKNIDVAWVVSPKKIKYNLEKNRESFSISHNK